MKELLYLGKTDSKCYDGSYLHNYKCYCGVEFLALPRNIKRKKTQSCGCFRKSGGTKHRTGKTPGNALKDPTESSFNGLYLAYKFSAKTKNMVFELTKEYFRLITKTNCYYCNDSPSGRYLQTAWAREPYIYNGIDRYDNKKGYTIANSRPCCSKCNYFKSGMHGDDFITYIRKIALNIVS